MFRNGKLYAKKSAIGATAEVSPAFLYVLNYNFSVVKEYFHYAEIVLSLRWNYSFTTLKLKFDQDRLIKDTDKKDAGGMRKEWGTGEKECGNLLDKECEQG